jgi:hypothetical protein
LAVIVPRNIHWYLSVGDIGEYRALSCEGYKSTSVPWQWKEKEGKGRRYRRHLHHHYHHHHHHHHHHRLHGSSIRRCRCHGGLVPRGEVFFLQLLEVGREDRVPPRRRDHQIQQRD